MGHPANAGHTDACQPPPESMTDSRQPIQRSRHLPVRRTENASAISVSTGILIANPVSSNPRTAFSGIEGRHGFDESRGFPRSGIVQIEERKKPAPRAGQAVIRITTTTICGTDVHIVKGEYPVKPGLILGHEPVGVIDALGEGLEDVYYVGQRVIVWRDHAVRTVLLLPERRALAVRRPARRLALRQHHQRRMGRVSAGARCAREPRADSRRLERRAGRARAGHLFHRPFRRRERQHQRRRRVAVFAQGPIGLCATLGAKLRGAALIIGVDASAGQAGRWRKRFGANVVINYREQDPVAEIKRLTGGRGADVTIEALGQQTTFENALRATRPGGTLSSLGVYSGKLVAPVRSDSTRASATRRSSRRSARAARSGCGG